eukprot:jgi/Bigna1/73617/fgenesh1_pg.25_\
MTESVRAFSRLSHTSSSPSPSPSSTDMPTHKNAAPKNDSASQKAVEQKKGVSSLLPKELKGEGDTSRQWENENDVLVIPKFEQNPNKFVQLIPTFPTITPGIDGNPTGADPTFVIQASLYGGWWIRVRKKTTRSALQMHMKKLSIHLQSGIEAKKSGAVYVAIPQSLLQSDVMTLLGKEAGYKFYTHNEEREEMILDSNFFLSKVGLQASH